MMGDVQSTQQHGNDASKQQSQSNQSTAAAAAAQPQPAQAAMTETGPKFPPPSAGGLRPAFKPHTHPITDDYKISKNVLGVGINGKVVECVKRKTNEKFALKVRDLIF